MYNKFNQKKSIVEKVKIKEEAVKEINYKSSIEEIESKIGKKEIIDAIKKVKDPELDIDIWSLELIYDIEVKDKELNIKMTFTSPTCPYGQEIKSNLKAGLRKIGYESNIEIVFSPIWKPSEELKEALGLEDL